ncbi:hypothetical protein ACU4GA_32055 [Methylobacterium oryzae CBMB20]
MPKIGPNAAPRLATVTAVALAVGKARDVAAKQAALNKLTHPRTNLGCGWTRFAESVHMNSHVGRIGRGPMTAEERLAELKAADIRRQTRRREALKQKGMTQQNVWLKPSVKAVIDQAIQERSVQEPHRGDRVGARVCLRGENGMT